jgi:hypothetical protein
MEWISPVVGSSAKITEGLAMSSQAMDNLFFSPPLMPRTFASPTRVSAQEIYPPDRTTYHQFYVVH